MMTRPSGSRPLTRSSSRPCFPCTPSPRTTARHLHPRTLPDSPLRSPCSTFAAVLASVQSITGASAAPAPAAGASAAPAPSTSPPNLRKRPHYLSSVDLLNALPGDVYTALDANAHLDINVRSKLHKSIESAGLEARLDLAVSAPFGYQVSLQHSRGTPWNSLARGLALALAGRYVHVDAHGSVDSDDQLDAEAQRTPALERHRANWLAMLDTWSSDHEISLSQVGSLWQGVTWVMRERCRHSSRWLCDEVQKGCARQVEELKSYPTSVTAAITSATYASLDPAAQRRARNRETLTFFTPFWYEHILERQRQDGPAVTLEVEARMKPTPLPWTPAQHQLHHPPHFPTHNPYAPVAPPTAPNTRHQPAAFPPAGGPPSAAPSPAPGPPGQPTHLTGFIGLPTAKVIVGQDIGFDLVPGPPTCTCAINIFFPGSVHRGYECPLRYIARFGSCPGWALPGARIPSAWNGDTLAPATRAEWTAYIIRHKLTSARAAGRDLVTF